MAPEFHGVKMKLKRVETRNYRILQNIVIPFSPSYCTISGKNNAGKSCIIRLLLNLFQKEVMHPWAREEVTIRYKEDKTQWLKDQESITVTYILEISRKDDPALVAFVEKFSQKQISAETIELQVDLAISSTEAISILASLDGQPLDLQTARAIRDKLRTSNLLFHHNPTEAEEVYFADRRRRAFYEVLLADSEQKQLNVAAQNLERKIRKLARDHKEKLNDLLGKLDERYSVGFSVLQRYSTRHHTFGINLNDKNVDIPLDDWGSGTQNRTHVLISILQARRIKEQAAPEDRITPIVVIEEPESFLHPSAQAEFGKILRELSSELGIQIIVTTHSPYMLNRENPASNILLSRRSKRKKLLEASLIATSGDDWMKPFAEHLGIPEAEWRNWRALFGSSRKVLLVEGETDKEYLEHLRCSNIGPETLNHEIAITAYGGKDVLKNNALLKFALTQLDRYLITFDRDALDEVKRALEGLGLKMDVDFVPVGLAESGKDSIEGLVPTRILQIVYGRETDLVSCLAAQDSTVRKRAKDERKRKIVEEFKAHTDYSNEELRGFSGLIRKINERFAS